MTATRAHRILATVVRFLGARLAPAAMALAALAASAGTITVTPLPVGGTVTSSVGGLNCGAGGSACVSTVIPTGALVTLTATPVSGYEFVVWTIPGLGTIATNPVTNSMPAFSFSASATFQLAPLNVTSLLPETKTLVVGDATSLAVTLGVAPIADTVVNIDAQPAGILSAPATVTVLAGQSAASVPIGALVPGTATVTATLGPSSAVSTIEVLAAATVPGAPRIGGALAGFGQVTVEFLPPLSDGGATITSYTAISSPGGITASAPASPITVTGLTNGTPYTFTVTATNSAGVGPPSDPSLAATPIATLPGQPLACTASLSGNLAITVGCAPGSPGSSPVTSYAATSSPGGLTGSSADPAAIVVSGLARGVDYSFTVTATSDVGTGPASDPTSPVTAYATPGAPTGVTAVGGIGNATLTWAAPADNGGMPVGSTLTYSVYATPGGKLTNSATSGGTVAIPVGVPTTFTVSATNDAGEGPQSAPSNSVMATSNPPNAPTRIHAMAGNARATVSFLASSSDGGSPITSYVVTSSPGGITASGAHSPISVTGLANGAPYTFTVAAVNLAGTGTSSVPSNVVTPNPVGPRTSPRAYVPSCNDNLVAVIDTATSQVIDTVPVGICPTGVAVNSAGTRVYTGNLGDGSISVIDASNHTVVATVPVGPDPFGIAVNHAGTRVYVGDPTDGMVRAIDAGTNTVLATVPVGGAMGLVVHPSGSPVYVGSFTEKSNSLERLDGSTIASLGSVSLAFPPLGLALSPAGGNVYVTSAGSSSVATVVGDAVTGTVNGLPGTPYGIAVSPSSGRQYVAISAANVVSVIDNGVAVDAIGVGATPRGIAVTPSGSRVYAVNADDGTVSVINTSSNSVVTTIPVGVGPVAFGHFIGPEPVLLPGAPTSVVATPGNAQASVAFLPPASDGGGAITSYTATSSPSGITASSATSPVVVTGLTNGVAYTFTVTATNSAGTGPASAPSNSVTPRAVPGAPTGVTAAPGNTQVTISFTPPASDGGSPITLYTATCTPGPFQGSNSASPIVVNGLANGTAYACTVTATNAAGTSLPSAAANATPNIFLLSVAKAGAGTGGVTSSPAGIDCGTTCAVSFINTTPVTLAAAPTGGSTFVGWNGACTGTGTCQVTMDAAKSVTATFDPATTPASAEVAITQAANLNPAGALKDVIVTLTVTNNGPATATGVVVSSPVPAGATYVWTSAGACANNAGTVTCNVASLASGASAAFKVVLRPNAAGTVTNVATVTATQSDPSSPNNTSSLAMPVVTTPAGVPVQRYRLYSDVTKEHHFTTDLNEYNVLGTYVGTWVQEGGVGKILNNPGSFGGAQGIPYYRLYDNSTRWHHWTTDANEYYTLGFVYSGWNMEGVDGWILPTNAPGTTQLYRLNYPYLGSLHHWTIDANEYNTLIASYGWIGEPGAGFVVQ